MEHKSFFAMLKNLLKNLTFRLRDLHLESEDMLNFGLGCSSALSPLQN